MIKPRPRIVDLSEVEPNCRRGGDLRALLTPATVGSTSGFMGVAIVQPGDRIGEHYHPYSEEFVYVVCGRLEVDLDGEALGVDGPALRDITPAQLLALSRMDLVTDRRAPGA